MIIINEEIYEKMPLAIKKFFIKLKNSSSAEVMAEFDKAGNRGAFAPVKSGQKGFGGVIYEKYKSGRDDGKSFYEDGLGSPARFFYCAKASKAERNMGCEELEEKEMPHSTAMKCAKCGLPILCGTGQSTCKCDVKEEIHLKARNNHPTVKPIKLMEYLIKMITPKNGIVLDPFLGSGTTAVACKQLGFNFIGIEKDSGYIEIAKRRIASVPNKLNDLSKFNGVKA